MNMSASIMSPSMRRASDDGTKVLLADIRHDPLPEADAILSPTFGF